MGVVILETRKCVGPTDVQSTHSKVLEHVPALRGTFGVHSNFKVTPLLAEYQRPIEANTQINLQPTVSSSRCQFIATELGAIISAVGHMSFAGGNFLNLFHSSESCNLAMWSLLRNSSSDVPVFLIMADRNDMT